jgi:rubredoxin
MTPHPDLVGAQRFFARVRSFDLECPHCGLVYRIRKDTRPNVWNPRTARFCCLDRDAGGCQRSYVIGVLAWPVEIGGGHMGNVPPADQVPGPRQLAQLRQEAGGWWLTDEYRHRGRPNVTNLTGELDRPPEEDPIDVDLAISDVREYRCQQCYHAYRPSKSSAENQQAYCSKTCEEAP